MSSISELYARFRQLIHEGAKFLIIGAIGAIVTFGVANALHPIGRYKAITIATILATVITYLGNRYWSFRHRHGKGTPRDSALFFVFNGVGLLIYYACIGLIDLAGLGKNLAWYNVALVVGTGLGTLFRFWSYRRWIWIAHPAEAPAIEELTPEMAAVAGAARAVGSPIDPPEADGGHRYYGASSATGSSWFDEAPSANGASANGASANGASANGDAATRSPRSHAKPGRPSFRHPSADQPPPADGRAPVSHRRQS